jgi:hypothetical protein
VKLRTVQLEQLSLMDSNRSNSIAFLTLHLLAQHGALHLASILGLSTTA